MQGISGSWNLCLHPSPAKHTSASGFIREAHTLVFICCNMLQWQRRSEGTDVKYQPLSPDAIWLPWRGAHPPAWDKASIVCTFGSAVSGVTWFTELNVRNRIPVLICSLLSIITLKCSLGWMWFLAWQMVLRKHGKFLFSLCDWCRHDVWCFYSRLMLGDK